MKDLSSAGIAIIFVSAFLFLALTAQLYYLLWWKKKRTAAKTQVFGEEEEEIVISPDKDLVIPFGEEGIEAELMRLHSLSGPPRFLFTIKEETKEDLESEDGTRKISRGKSLGDMLFADHTPYLTPLSSPPPPPPLTPIDCNSQQGFNALFESFKDSSSSPPPKLKFLRDAEEKLYKKLLSEEAMRSVHRCSSSTPTKGIEDGDDGSFITIIIGKNHPNSSQVNPLSSSPPPIIRPAHGKV